MANRLISYLITNNKTNMQSPFDVIDAFFSEKAWKEVTSLDKSKYYFIINRVMTKENPVWASYFNHVRINPVAVVDFWKWFLSARYSRKPNWIYVSGSKKKKEEKAKAAKKSKNVYIPKDDVIEKYISVKSVSRKEFDAAMTAFPESTLQDLQELENMMYHE